MDLTLGCHSNLIGVGEVARVILHENFKTNNFEFLDNVQCACGNITIHCIFWSKDIPELKENNHLSVLVLKFKKKLLAKQIWLNEKVEYISYHSFTKSSKLRILEIQTPLWKI